MSIVWHDGLKTGIPIIDEQHKFIIETLSGIETSKLTESEIYQIFMDLQAYLSDHFKTEEKYMIDTDYPGYEGHKANHKKVLSDCKNILTHNITHKLSDITFNFVTYMENWFTKHYAEEDIRLVEYLKKNKT